MLLPFLLPAYPFSLRLRAGLLVLGCFSVLCLFPAATAQPMDDTMPEALKTVLEKAPLENESARTKKQRLEALETYNHGVELFRAAQEEAQRGERYNHWKLLRQSQSTFRKALKLEPSLVEAHSNLGFTWLSAERYDKAIDSFQDALKVNPKHLGSLNGLATAYSLNQELDKALATFEILNTLAPGNAQYWFNRGSVLQKYGQAEAAETAYRQTLKLEPEHQAAWFNLATLFDNAGETGKARQAYEKAKEAGIDTPIGLESYRRLKALDRSVLLPESTQADDTQAPSKKSTP